MNTEIEILALKYLNGDYSIREFEKEIYQIKDESRFYEDLLQLDYSSKFAKHELLKTINIYVSSFEIEKYLMLKTLEDIISDSTKTFSALLKTYDLKCHGYWFLQNLGMAIALKIISSEDKTIKKLTDVSSSVKTMYENELLPLSRIEAKRIIELINSQKIILTGNTKGDIERKCWIDNRMENEIDENEIRNIQFHAQSHLKTRETKNEWVQGGPLFEISSLKKNKEDKKKIIEEEISILKNWNVEFRITCDNETLNNQIQEYTIGYIDEGVKNRTLNINCIINLSGQRKAVFQIVELSKDLYLTNLYFYGSRLSAEEWNEQGVSLAQENDIVKNSMDYIKKSNPIILCIAYEDDCTSFFKTEKAYPSSDFTTQNLDLENIANMVKAKENGFEYCYINSNYLGLSDEYEIRKTA